MLSVFELFMIHNKKCPKSLLKKWPHLQWSARILHVFAKLKTIQSSRINFIQISCSLWTESCKRTYEVVIYRLCELDPRVQRQKWIPQSDQWDVHLVWLSPAWVIYELEVKRTPDNFQKYQENWSMEKVIKNVHEDENYKKLPSKYSRIYEIQLFSLYFVYIYKYNVFDHFFHWSINIFM